MNSIISLIMSIAQKIITKWSIPLFMFFVGHRLASKNAKIKAQQQNLKTDQVAMNTLKKMQEAEASAPSDKQSLLQSLSKGDF